MQTPDAADKPVDVGSGRVAASFDTASAAWLSIGATHPELGFVELSALPLFDERSRGDPAATRRHRLAMTEPDHAWLMVDVDGSAPPLIALHEAGARVARWDGGSMTVEAWAPDDEMTVVQRWRFHDGPREVAIRVRGRLDRPALAEVTEIDPPQPTGGRSSWDHAGDDAVACTGTAGRVTVRVAAPWERVDGGFAARVRAVEVAVWVTIGAVDTGGAFPQTPSPTDIGRDRLTARSLAYIRGCTTLRFGPDERTMLTDHRILPLSWTRDAYWQAQALLVADGPGDRERVADHLRWLWRRCERPDGRWVRSHHANGRRKDLAFQADQQLYPMVELADWWRLTGSVPDGVDWPTALHGAWGVIRVAIDQDTGLVPSAENAADDPAAAPFIAASQLVAWYTAERLAELGEATGLGPSPASLREDAASLRASFDRHFAAVAPWPYAVDGTGGRIAYHDANDLPVALAPAWGYCAASDPGWRATMDFALGPSNPGWVAGERAGLGSAHTPGPWTLGDIQRWIAGRLSGDESSPLAAARRLDEVAFSDGMLPEAYAAEGAGRVRHWFAWPGAAWAALRMLDDQDRLGTALLAVEGR